MSAEYLKLHQLAVPTAAARCGTSHNTAAGLEAADAAQGLSPLLSMLDSPHPWLALVTDNKLKE